MNYYYCYCYEEFLEFLFFFCENDQSDIRGVVIGRDILCLFTGFFVRVRVDIIKYSFFYCFEKVRFFRISWWLRVELFVVLQSFGDRLGFDGGSVVIGGYFFLNVFQLSSVYQGIFYFEEQRCYSDVRGDEDQVQFLVVAFFFWDFVI